jgi:hypothetical protein
VLTTSVMIFLDISSLTSPNVGTVTNIRTISNNNDDDDDATEDASHSVPIPIIVILIPAIVMQKISV